MSFIPALYPIPGFSGHPDYAGPIRFPPINPEAPKLQTARQGFDGVSRKMTWYIMLGWFSAKMTMELVSSELTAMFTMKFEISLCRELPR